MKSDKKAKRTFSAISINRITSERFRSFSKNVSRSHSDTLEHMMDFFEIAKISPRNKLMMYHFKLYSSVISRLDFIVELIREQEQKYHKPTHDMLKSLFDGTALARSYQPLKEKLQLRETIQEKFEPSISVEKYNSLRDSFQQERQEFLSTLNKIEKIKPRFGKPYYKIEMEASELAILKRKLKG